MNIKQWELAAAVLAGATLAGCATSHRLSGPELPSRFRPSSEFLESVETGDAEAQCKLGWLYLADHNYNEAAKWLLKSGNINSSGAAGRLLVEGRGVPRDVPRGIQCLRRGAECPNIGGNEECALDLARIYEKGELVCRNDSEAYYFLGICVAKCAEGDETLDKRPQLVAHQRTVGARLPAEEERTKTLDFANGWMIGKLEHAGHWVSWTRKRRTFRFIWMTRTRRASRPPARQDCSTARTSQWHSLARD